jgi:hypothetical protein
VLRVGSFKVLNCNSIYIVLLTNIYCIIIYIVRISKIQKNRLSRAGQVRDIPNKQSSTVYKKPGIFICFMSCGVNSKCIYKTGQSSGCELKCYLHILVFNSGMTLVAFISQINNALIVIFLVAFIYFCTVLTLLISKTCKSE